ncbi:MAG: hypothetical protein NXI32_13555, partial [bacterium]|nr:hypothetical protein [bacterium]
ADGSVHGIQFEVPIAKSSWIAIRQFPQLHTNPIQVIIAEQPIRASRQSALWCLESTRILWKNRSRFIAEEERPAARKAYEEAIRQYALRADQCEDDGSRYPALDLPERE